MMRSLVEGRNDEGIVPLLFIPHLRVMVKTIEGISNVVAGNSYIFLMMFEASYFTPSGCTHQLVDYGDSM